MVPLVKNHYDIYSRNNTTLDSDTAVFVNVKQQSHQQQQSQQRQPKTVIVNGNKSYILNNALKTNGGKSKKTLVITLATNGQPRLQSSSISLPNAGRGGGRNKIPPAVKNACLAKVKAASNPRPLPHIRRTVRNPINNRVYSYSVSIPDYVAEEDEDQLAQEEKELASAAAAQATFSTSAPAGTGTIGNGILCEDDDDDEDLLCYDSEEITSADTTPSSSMPSSPDGVNDKHKLRSQTFDISLHELSKQKSLPDSIDNSLIPKFSSPKHPLNHLSNACPPSNSREYTELLRKFVLHLKMLKIGSARRLFSSSSSSNNKTESEELNGKSSAGSVTPRRRKNTLEDSKYL